MIVIKQTSLSFLWATLQLSQINSVPNLLSISVRRQQGDLDAIAVEIDVLYA